MAAPIDVTLDSGSGELQLAEVSSVTELDLTARLFYLKKGNASDIRCTLLLTLISIVLSKSLTLS